MKRSSPNGAAWKAIAARLRARIESGEFPAGARLPSGDRLAAELGVNRNAVHRAVEELQREGIVVRRTGSGTVVAPREAPSLKRVALLVNDLAPEVNHPAGDLLKGLQEGLGERVHLVVAHSANDLATERRQIENLSDEMDGLVVYPIVANDCVDLYERLQERGYPLVALDRRHPGTECDAVFTEDRAATHGAVSRLIESGARRIGFMAIRNFRMQSIPERYEGYRSAIEEAGLTPHEEDVRWFPLGSKLDPPAFNQLVEDAVHALMRRREPLDALFSPEDHFTHTVLQACARLGVSVPDDLEIAAFSDWPPEALQSPWNVHRLVQRKADIGRAAARLLLDRVADPRRAPQTVRIPADFLPMGAGLPGSAFPLVDQP